MTAAGGAMGVDLGQVDRQSALPRRIADPKLKQRIDITPLRIGKPAADKKLGAFLTDGHEIPPLNSVVEEVRSKSLRNG